MLASPLSRTLLRLSLTPWVRLPALMARRCLRIPDAELVGPLEVAGVCNDLEAVVVVSVWHKIRCGGPKE